MTRNDDTAMVLSENAEDEGIALSTYGSVLGVESVTVRIDAEEALDLWHKMKEVDSRADVFSINLLGADIDIQPESPFGGAWEMQMRTVYGDSVTVSAVGKHAENDKVEYTVTLAEIEDHLVTHGLLPETDRRITPQPAPTPGM